MIGGGSDRKEGEGLPGFNIYYSRHIRRWLWKEITPSKVKGHNVVSRKQGFIARRDAYLDAKAEVERREREQSEKAAKRSGKQSKSEASTSSSGDVDARRTGTS